MLGGISIGEVGTSNGEILDMVTSARGNRGRFANSVFFSSVPMGSLMNKVSKVRVPRAIGDTTTGLPCHSFMAIKLLISHVLLGGGASVGAMGSVMPSY